MADDAAPGGAAPPPPEPEARASEALVSREPSETPSSDVPAAAPAEQPTVSSADNEAVSADELEALSDEPKPTEAAESPLSAPQAAETEGGPAGREPWAERFRSLDESRSVRPPPVQPPRPTTRREWWQSRRTLWLAAGSLGLCLLIVLDVIWMQRAAERAPDSASSAQPPPQPAPGAAPIAVPSSVVPGVELDDGAEEPHPSEAKSAANEPDDTALPAFDEDDGDSEPSPKKPKAPPHFGTVQEAAARSCSTASVDGLSRQIIEQGRCINPKAFVPLPSRPNLVVGEHVFAYLEASARDGLLRALDSRKKSTMTINSALRTVAQQYLVWRWSASKRCGVQLATPPGESNHETGMALDIAEQADWRQTLEQHDFHWLGAIDRVHFDYKGGASSASSQRAVDVLAFQQLWNRNNPSDTIAESGHYNPETEQRLKKSPPDGFASGAACKGRTPKPSSLANSGKRRR